MSVNRVGQALAQASPVRRPRDGSHVLNRKKPGKDALKEVPADIAGMAWLYASRC